MTSSPSLILFVVLLFHRLDTVSCQMKVQASVGDAVLLPCIYSSPNNLRDSAPVFWRDRNDNIVLDIRNKAPDLLTQSPKFKGRVVWKEEMYSRGNFSIVMKNVQKADSGPYECHLPSLDFESRIMLSVSERVESSRGITAVGLTSQSPLRSVVCEPGGAATASCCRGQPAAADPVHVRPSHV